VPDQKSAGPQHPREFLDDLCVIGWMREKTEGRKEIQHRVKSSRPTPGESAHIAALIAQIWSRSALPRDI
jgi:hypothetical protein